jgi:hypothetical protein
MAVRLCPGSAGYRWTFMFQITATRRETGSEQRGLLYP